MKRHGYDEVERIDVRVMVRLPRKAASVMSSKCVMMAVIAALVAAMGSAASADLWNGVEYDFVDVIDTWGPSGLNTAWIGQDNPLSYEHDITGYDVPAHFWVTEAWLNLDFTNDLSDSAGSVSIPCLGIISWDLREFTRVGYKEDSWMEVGEVDNGQYDLVVDIDWLNDDGILDVTLNVSNPLGTATAWLDHSALYGNLVGHTPAPAAVLLGLLGLGTAGLKLRRWC